MPGDAEHRLIWRFYATESRKVALEELRSLPEHGRAALSDLIKRFRRGESMRDEVKKLPGTQGLWELRATAGGQEFRAIFFFDGSMICVSVVYFEKKSKRTPGTVLKTAKKRMKAWQAADPDSNGPA